MEDFKPRTFGYAHSKAIMAALKEIVSKRGSIISGGYDFLEKPGEHSQFDEMIALAKQGGRDVLYVDTVKEFAGKSLMDFKQALSDIDASGMKICSQSEPNYSYGDYIAVIEVLEELMPGYQKNRQSIEAVALAKIDIAMEDICSHTGLAAADVFQALADYEREQENA